MVSTTLRRAVILAVFVALIGFGGVGASAGVFNTDGDSKGAKSGGVFLKDSAGNTSTKMVGGILPQKNYGMKKMNVTAPEKATAQRKSTNDNHLQTTEERIASMQAQFDSASKTRQAVINAEQAAREQNMKVRQQAIAKANPKAKKGATPVTQPYMENNVVFTGKKTTPEQPTRLFNTR